MQARQTDPETETELTVGEDLPQLRALLWNRAAPVVTEREAFALYEMNRQWVEVAAMGEHERRFFDALVLRFGAGVFLG